MVENDMVSDRGTVIRIVDSHLAYIFLDKAERSVSFELTAFRSGGTTSLIAVGSRVDVKWRERDDVVTSIGLVDGDLSRAPLDELSLKSNAANLTEAEQIELDVKAEPNGAAKIFRALPKKMRSFGKIIDTSVLLPGDLLLSRNVVPDGISRAIVTVQEQGGYGKINARWTHAAMYVGDGRNVVEATFESVISGGSVRLTSLDEYCDGSYCLRFRRPVGIETDQDRWRLCVRALAKLSRSYDFGDAMRMWFRVIVQGKGFNSDERRGPISKATICSTLYADAYNEATQRSLGEIGGVCVPAWLSGSDAFSDIPSRWLEI